MVIKVLDDANALARAAAAHAASSLRSILKAREKARLVAATGASQLAFLRELTSAKEIDWSRVELFHLDEYIGLPQEHPASFCRYLRQNLIEPAGITNHHLMNGAHDTGQTIREVSRAISSAPIDLAFVGIGENGHLAFNDPPADFQSQEPYLIVKLDEACRRQQVGEGWFATISQVPDRAISMSISQILAAHEIICVVPDARKAQAVHTCFDGKVSPMAPASILRTHSNTMLYLDKDSAAQLNAATLSELASSA